MWALYPLWKLRESGAEVIFRLAEVNPFSHAVELVRFALYGQLNGLELMVVVGALAVFFVLAVLGYEPQRGLMKRKGRPG
jgi:ABC-2 type transport system permease protein